MSSDLDALKEAGRKVTVMPAVASRKASAFSSTHGRMKRADLMKNRIAHSYFETDDSAMKGQKLQWDPNSEVVTVPEGYVPGKDVGFSGFNNFLKQGLRAPQSAFEARHTKCFSNCDPDHMKDIGLGNDKAGFAVLPEYAPDIFSRMYESDIYSRTANYTVAGNTMRFPKLAETDRNGKRHGGVVHYWTDERGRYKESEPDFDTTNLSLKKLTVLVYLTDELVDDNSYALEQFVVEMASREIEFALNNSAMNGKGGGQPLGVLDPNAGHTITVPRTNGPSTISTEDLLNILSRRLRPGENTWGWWYNQECIPQLGLLTNGTVPIFMTSESGGIQNDVPSTILGIPSYPSEFCPALADRGCIGLFDWSKYVTISKGELRQASSTHVEFLRDITALKFTFRMDGRPFEDAEIEPYMAGATQPETQSSFIVLG